MGSSQDSPESDQHSQQSAPEDGSLPYVDSPDPDMAEGELASLAADAVSGEEESWALTDEQRQAERELRAPPSGEPLYPDRRGGLAWEPFSDDEMDLTVSPHYLASGALVTGTAACYSILRQARQAGMGAILQVDTAHDMI